MTERNQVKCAAVLWTPIIYFGWLLIHSSSWQAYVGLFSPDKFGMFCSMVIIWFAVDQWLAWVERSKA